MFGSKVSPVFIWMRMIEANRCLGKRRKSVLTKNHQKFKIIVETMDSKPMLVLL